MRKKVKENPIDVHVGNRMQLRRMMLHMSQKQMAQEMKVTFQQIQKYEKGQNRISASRLYDIAQILQVSMNYFFEDIDSDTAQKSPRCISMTEDKQILPPIEIIETDPFLKEETARLIVAYYRIKNRNIAQDILNLVCRLSRANSLFPEE